MKKTKKIMSLALALVMLLTVIVGSVSVFAANNIESRYDQNGWRINGWVDLSNVVNNVKEKEFTDASGKTIYKGNIVGSAEATDLFEGAYNKYEQDYKGHVYWFGKAENFVMFNKGDKFPTVDLTVTFPNNFNIDYDNIELKSGTTLVSKIEIEDFANVKDEKRKTFKLRFYLGNWNDYQEFFAMYEKIKGETGHKIEISIPYSVDITNNNQDTLGNVSSEGVCALFKGGNKFSGTQLVYVELKKHEISIVK